MPSGPWKAPKNASKPWQPKPPFWLPSLEVLLDLSVFSGLHRIATVFQRLRPAAVSYAVSGGGREHRGCRLPTLDSRDGNRQPAGGGRSLPMGGFHCFHRFNGGWCELALCEWSLERRDSVLEPKRSEGRQPQAARRVSGANQCVRQALARRRFRRPDGKVRPKSIQHLTKAVSPMQACAVHLCHRSPRRCRVAHVHPACSTTMHALK